MPFHFGIHSEKAMLCNGKFFAEASKMRKLSTFDLGQVIIPVILSNHMCQFQLTCLPDGIASEEPPIKEIIIETF